MALLALRQGKEVQRAWLAEMLWPDNDKGLASLSTALSDLRGALGDQAGRLISAGRSLRLDLSDAEVDIIEFDALISRGEIADLERAVTLYEGPLLEDCVEAWVGLEREQRANTYVTALETLAIRALTDGDSESAIHRLRKAVAADSEQESPHRLLMKVLSEAGDYAGAITVFADLRQRRQCYNATPSDATTALYRHILVQSRKKPATRPQPALATADAVTINVPHPLTPLLGRDEELHSINAAILASRLVTLTGTGGVGKTRLATEAAISMAPSFVHGVYMVGLDALTDPELIPQQIANTLRLETAVDGSWQEALLNFVRNRQILLVLDNCEHLLGGAANLTRLLLRECANLNILATSRERLGLTGEVNISVRPLMVPERRVTASLPQSLEFPAVRLFCDRAKSVRFDFALSQQNYASVIQICQDLDGLPLALELAAALVEMFDVQEIAKRLDRRFDLLHSGDRTAPRRHQALDAALTWGYDLLTMAERSLLSRLCIFSGGWTIDAAEFLDKELAGNGMGTISVLSRLVSKSLVQTTMTPLGMRYQLLDTIRAYGRERLLDPTTWQQIQEKHCEYYTDFARTAATHLQGLEQALWLDRLEQEHANLRVALTWATRSGGDPVPALRLTSALWRFWYARGHHVEGVVWLQRSIEMAGDRSDGLQQGALKACGNLFYATGKFTEARVCFHRCLELAFKTKERQAQASALASLALAEQGLKEFTRANTAFAQALQIFEQEGDIRGCALTLSNMAMLACQGEQNFIRAKELHLRGLELFRRIGALHSIAQECANLVHTLLQLNQIDEIRPYLEESLTIGHDLKIPLNLVTCVTQYKTLAIAEGQYERAAVLMGADMALREVTGLPLPAEAQKENQSTKKRLRSHFGAARLAEYLAQGRAMAMEDPDEELYPFLLNSTQSP